LQADIVDISSREEQARQENSILEAPENPAMTVDTSVILQDSILGTSENLAMMVDTLVNLQDLQEPIVTSSAIHPSQDKVCYIFELFASSFSCTMLISYFLSGLEPFRAALI
jgi:predicted house-cleaning NTP pyrophosphatase (Maf/HAM1 superfamily)